MKFGRGSQPTHNAETLMANRSCDLNKHLSIILLCLLRRFSPLDYEHDGLYETMPNISWSIPDSDNTVAYVLIDV